MTVVTISNQKGGVGKTTTAANLGVLLSRHGRRVLVVDADPQFALTRQIGVEERSLGVNLVDVLAGRAAAADAIVGHVHGVDVIAAAPAQSVSFISRSLGWASPEEPLVAKRPRVLRRFRPANGAWRRCFRRLAADVPPCAYSQNIRREMPGMTAATTTPLQSKFGPIVADAAGTITVQEASDVLDCSRFRVCELLNPSEGRVGRVLVTDVLALKSFVPPSALEAAPAAKLVG
jgi:hypothetical protein